MSDNIVERGGPVTSQTRRERLGVLVVAAGVVSIVAVYVALNATTHRGSAKDLLPYQTLVRDLPEADQQLYRALRQGLVAAEAERARTGTWPEPTRLAALNVAPFTSAAGAGSYQWSRMQQGAIFNYFGRPLDPSVPAWLLEIQEPEPGMLPDPAPLDDEHHRLPDGTTLHTYVWMHRFGGQVPLGFVRQPQSSGWVEVFSTPPDPVFYNRR
jgi:hypothetical protein